MPRDTLDQRHVSRGDLYLALAVSWDTWGKDVSLCEGRENHCSWFLSRFKKQWALPINLGDPSGNGGEDLRLGNCLLNQRMLIHLYYMYICKVIFSPIWSGNM